MSLPGGDCVSIVFLSLILARALTLSLSYTLSLFQRMDERMPLEENVV